MAILAPILLDASSSAAYFLFGGLALATVAVLYAYMPETRGRTLEDIQEAFHQPAISTVVTSFIKTLRIRKRRSPAEGTELEPHHITSTEASVGLAAGNVARPLRLGASS